MKWKLSTPALAAGVALILATSCQSAPPPPPARVELSFSQSGPITMGFIGYYVKVTTRRPEILAADGFEHCKPKVESWKATKTALREPAYPDRPGYEGVIRDVWNVHNAQAVFSVAADQECWDEALWNKAGGHPYVGTWYAAGEVKSIYGGAIRHRSYHAYLDDGYYTIVK